MPQLDLSPIAEEEIKFIAVRLNASEWSKLCRWIKRERKTNNPRAGIRDFFLWSLKNAK